MKCYLIAYAFTSYRGAGRGRSFVTTPKDGVTSPGNIKEWERQIREANGFESVGIENIVLLDSAEGL